MEINKAIEERRSIRDYKDKKVSWDKVSEILDSARYAPSSGNLQNLYFVIVQDKKKREDIAKASLNQMWMKDAPVHIVVCNKLEKVKTMYGDRGEFYSIQNCAMASQNIMLKAQSLNLGTCFVGALDDIKLQRLLKLPDFIRVEGVITLGYPKTKGKPPRKLNLERITFFEQWLNPKK